MSAIPENNPLSETERLDAAAAQAIAACDGNMMSAIRALILANEYLEFEICELMKAVSRGYPRGEIKPRLPAGKASWFD